MVCNFIPGVLSQQGIITVVSGNIVSLITETHKIAEESAGRVEILDLIEAMKVNCEWFGVAVNPLRCLRPFSLTAFRISLSSSRIVRETCGS